MFTWKRLLLACSGCFLLAIAFVMFILPGIISERAKEWVSEETGRSLEIESISINPFSLTAEIRKLRLSDTDQAKPFVSWDLFRVSLSVASLYHRAPVIDELRLELPFIHLERLTADRFNFSDLIPEQGEDVANQAADEPGRFSINNITISDGQIDLIDSSLEQPVHHKIQDLQLVLPAIGNLPYMVDNPAQPLFRATINDAPINLESELKVFTDSQQMRFGLVLENIDLPFYLGYVPVELPVELRNGKLSLDLDILYRLTADDGAQLVLSGQIDLASLDIWDRQEEKLFFLPLLQIEMAPTQPLKPNVHLSSLRVYNLEVQLNRNSGGEWNHARMAAKKETSSPPAEEEAAVEGNPLRLLIDTIEIRDGVLFFEDNLAYESFNSVAREINIDVKDFALDAMTAIPLALSLKTDRDETITVNGNFLLDPFTLNLDTELKELQMGAYVPYYHDVYAGHLGGRLDLRASISVNKQEPLLISDGKIAWRDPYMAFNDQEGLGAARIDISGLSFDLGDNRLEIDSAIYEDGKVNFSRTAEGHWTFLSRNFPILAKLTEAPDEAAMAEKRQETPALSYRIGEFALRNWEFDVVDKLPKTAVKLKARKFNLVFNNLVAPEKAESPFTFSTVLQRNGQIEAKGKASLAAQKVDLSSRFRDIPLATFAPYLAEHLNLELADGYLNARLKSVIDAGAEPLQVTYNGDIGVSRFHMLDGLHREDLLKWNSLQFAKINGQIEPLTLTMESITLSDYFAKVLIDEDARLNLAEAFSRGPGNEGEEVPAEEDSIQAPEASAEEEKTGTAEVNIGKVILQGGQVDFTDRSLPWPFHADMRKLGGRIEGLSSSPESRAEVDLRGSLRNQSPLTITGSINPLAEKLYLDVSLNFRDIEMSPLSPYSGNFVGYLIEKGKLNLALDYVIEDGRLKAKNKVFLDQFSFGEAVESEDAIGLPVNLAVALLKDGNGEIHLDIPVSGSLDDPQFSIAGVVWTVIKNLLVKAATSPFALLGALVGGGDEDFSSVSFDYGSSRLSDAEKDKLLRMAKALAERPSLDVEASGFVDPENDAEGYRREKLASQVRRLKYLDLVEDGKLPEGAGEDDVIVTAEEYADYLWQVYRKADFPKPRNFVGMTKKLPEAEMEKLIYTNTQVTQDQLSELAQDRALAVQNFLVDEGQLARERTFLKKPDITAAPEQEGSSRARVELGAAVR